MFSKKNLRKRRRGLADFIPGFHGNILSNPHDNHDNHEPHHCPLSASVSSSTAAMASVSPSALVAAEIVAWRSPAEYPRRPRRVAQSGVSRPGLDPPRREVTPGTMEAAINLKIAVDIAGACPRTAPCRHQSARPSACTVTADAEWRAHRCPFPRFQVPSDARRSGPRDPTTGDRARVDADRRTHSPRRPPAARFRAA